MEITKEDMANYVSSTFNNDYILQLVLDSNNREELTKQYCQLSKFIFSYVMATSDLSKDTLKQMLQEYINHKEEITQEKSNYNELTSEQKYFANYIFPIIVNRYKQKHNISRSLTLLDYINILKDMVINSGSNIFYTHSFAGALLDEISCNGLDISKEKFKKEINFLSQFGFRTPYRTGSLDMTELSYHTTSYALRHSEKIRFSFQNLTNIELKDSETFYEYHKRIINQFRIENSNFQGIDEVVEILNKINDFYFSNPESCIAIIKNKSIKPDDVYIPFLFENILSYNAYLFENLLKSDETFKKIYEHASNLLDSRNEDGYELLDTLINYMNVNYPNSEETRLLKEKIKFEYIYKVTHHGLNNFERANGDGYSAENGKINREQFSIATINNPILNYPNYKEKRTKQNNIIR